MDISIALSVFALTIFLISVGATVAASIISQRVLDEHTEVLSGPGLYLVNGAGRAQKAVDRTSNQDDEALPKAA